MARALTMSFEVERGNATVEYECVFDVSPGEPEIRWGDNACPGSGPEVESKAVYFVSKKTCPGCKGTGTVLFEHLDGVKTPKVCPNCRGAKRVTVREERPELEDLVDDEELLEHAGDQDDGPYDTLEEARGER